MDKRAVIERVCTAVYGHYQDLPLIMRREHETDIENALHAAGYFEIAEAAITMCREPLNQTDLEILYETLKKAGVLDE